MSYYPQRTAAIRKARERNKRGEALPTVGTARSVGAGFLSGRGGHRYLGARSQHIAQERTQANQRRLKDATLSEINEERRAAKAEGRDWGVYPIAKARHEAAEEALHWRGFLHVIRDEDEMDLDALELLERREAAIDAEMAENPKTKRATLYDAPQGLHTQPRWVHNVNKWGRTGHVTRYNRDVELVQCHELGVGPVFDEAGEPVMAPRMVGNWERCQHYREEVES